MNRISAFPNRGRTWAPPVFAALAVLFVLIVLLRWHTYAEPFERDIASHAVIGHGLSEGRELYSDLWDSKPPAVYVTYALADRIVGLGEQQVFFLNVFAALVSLLGVFFAASVWGGRTAGLLGAALWAVVSADLHLQANQPNIEVFMNGALVWAFALLSRLEGHHGLRRAILVGCLFALATFYKQVALAPTGLMGAAYLLLASAANRRSAWRHIGVVAVVGAAAWGALWGYFAVTGRGELFFKTLVSYGRYYTQSTSTGLGDNLLRSLTEWRALDTVLPLAVAGALGLILIWWRGPRRLAALLTAYVIGVHLAVALPGKFYPHYFQLWLPPMALSAAWILPGLAAGGWGTRVRLAAIISVVLATAGFQAPAFLRDVSAWSAEKSGGPQFELSKKLGLELRHLLEPGEGVYVWGINPEIYFHARLDPPTGIMWSRDTYEGPLARDFATRTIDDLRANPPELVVVNILHVGWWEWENEEDGAFWVPLKDVVEATGNKGVMAPRGYPVLDWVWTNYELLPGAAGRDYFLLFARRGGALIERARRKATIPAPSPK